MGLFERLSRLLRSNINDLIAKFATENDDYKKALFADPRKVVSMQRLELEGAL